MYHQQTIMLSQLEQFNRLALEKKLKRKKEPPQIDFSKLVGFFETCKKEAFFSGVDDTLVSLSFEITKPKNFSLQDPFLEICINSDKPLFNHISVNNTFFKFSFPIETFKDIPSDYLEKHAFDFTSMSDVPAFCDIDYQRKMRIIRKIDTLFDLKDALFTCIRDNKIYPVEKKASTELFNLQFSTKFLKFSSVYKANFYKDKSKQGKEDSFISIGIDSNDVIMIKIDHQCLYFSFDQFEKNTIERMEAVIISILSLRGAEYTSILDLKTDLILKEMQMH